MSRRISVVLDLDAGRFTAGMAGAATATSRLNINLDITQNSLNRVENRMKGLLATTRDLTVILGQARTALYNLQVVATGWIQAIVKTNVEMERMTFLLANMSEGLTVEERFRGAAESLNYLFDQAKQAPFSIGALTDSFVKMKSTGIDPTEGALSGLTNAVAAFGGSDEVLKRASIAIQQMSGKGVISMEELRQQLGEAVPSAVALMARSMDLSYGELVDKVSKGQVEASTALQKLFGEFERTFGGSNQAMMDTFAGKVSVAKTTLIELALAIGGFDRQSGGFADGSFMDMLNKQLQSFIDLLGTPEVGIFAKRLGDGLVASLNALNTLIGFFVKYREVIIAAGQVFLVYFGARAAVASLLGIASAVGGVTASFGTLSSAMKVAGSNFALIKIAQTIYNDGAATMAERNRAVVQGLTGMAGAFTRMLGPISIAISLILAAANAMGLFEDKAKKAKQASDDFALGLATADGYTLLKQRAEEAAAAVKSTTEFLASENRALQRTGSARYRVGVENLEKRLAEEKATLAKYEKELGEYEAKLKQNTSDKLITQVDRLIQAQTTNIRRKYDAQQNELDTARNEIAQREGISEEQRTREQEAIREKRLQLIQAQYREEIAVLDGYISSYEAQLKRLTSGQGASAADSVKFPDSTSAEEKARQLNELLANVIQQRRMLSESNIANFDIASGAGKFLTGTNANSGSSSTQEDSVGNMIDALSRRNAGLQAELQGTGKEIAKVEEQLRIWGENGVEYTIDQEKAMRDYANSIDSANQRIREQREDQSNFGRIGDQLKRQQTTAKELSALLAGGYSEAGAEAALFRMRLDEIVEELNNGSAAARIMADEAERLFSQNRTREFLINLKQTTDQINASLLEGNAAAQARHDADIARIYETIDLNQFYGEERMRMEAIVNDYIVSRGAQLQRETEGQFRGMLRTWTDTTAAMDQAAANWMDNFVNALVEGKASFGDFAKAILADIAKIILRAVIAQAILSALGFVGVGGGGGGNQPTNLLANRIPADAGGLTSSLAGSLYHNGGVVGSDRGMTKTVSAAVFAAAKRFHSGGLVGLKNDEVPAILQTGERVLNREETRAYGRGAGGAMNVQVNIINEGGQKMEEQSRSQRFDGESYIIDIVTQAAGQPGKMRTAIKEAARSS